MRVEDIINTIITREGGYVDDPDDRGGKTCWGITEAVARAHGYTGDMRDLSREEAFSIYWNDYWLSPKFNQVGALSMRIAEELTDTGVNMGPREAAKMLQRALNLMNVNGRIYPDIPVDGDIGALTLDALDNYLLRRQNERGEDVLLKLLNVFQGYRYVEIAERNPSQEKFIFGWLRERVA